MRQFSASRIARNSILNLLGQGVPFLAAVIAIPLLVRGLGTDRFGVLTLAWMIIGYFSLFDFGLGRALTQIVAERIAPTARQAPALVWTALGLMFALGLAGALLMALLAPWLVQSVLRIPEALRPETMRAFLVLAAAVPLVVLTAGLIGVLQAFHRFAVVNAIRLPMGIYTFAAPLLVLPYSRSLVWVAAVLAAGRLLACLAYAWACRSVLPPLPGDRAGQFKEIRPLFRFGAWMTVSNMVSPLMQYLDRFVIGATMSMAAVAYYATPYEAVTRTLILPGAILGVLFPAFAASYRQDHARLVRLYAQGTKYIALIMFPILLLVSAFAREGLQWWLGEEFALHSTPVLQVLAIGVFVNGIAQLFATLLQGVGRPDLSAKLHLVELPVYLLALWWAIQRFGVMGAALAWSGRMVVDGVVLFLLANRFLGDNAALVRRTAAGLLLALAGLVLPALAGEALPRAAILLVIVAVAVPTVWFAVLGGEERSLIRGRRWAAAGSR